MKKLKAIYKNNQKFINYTLVSIICTIILYSLYIILNYITNGLYILSNTIAYTVSFTILYLWDRQIFSSKYLRKKTKVKQLITFIIFRVLGYIIDSILLTIFIEKFNMPLLSSKIISSMITFVFNFITNKLFVFKIE